MADFDIPTEALEAAARDLAGRVKPSRHGNLCPVACVITPIDNCDCWILTQARADVAIVAPHLIAEGRRQAIAQLRDDERYRNWWSTLPPDSPDIYWHGQGRRHLADYLETIGPDHG